MGKLAYKLLTQAWFFLIRLLSPFNHRAALLIAGQKNLLSKYDDYAKQRKRQAIWFHVSSLGEYEQGRPVMEALKKTYPQYALVVTFFSPSGYEQRKHDPLCDATFYLPFESRQHAQQVVSCLDPAMAVWIKYDFWYEYLHALHARRIPLYLCAARFRPTQLFFKPWGRFQLNMLKLFSHIFCQDAASAALLNAAGISNNSVSGDNRYDRVYQSLQHAEPLPLIEAFKANSFLLIAGSSYHIEENMIASIYTRLHQKIKIIIAPHFVDAAHIENILKMFNGDAVLYSQCETGTWPADKSVLITDRIGLLAKAYRYGDAALIGGGFRHNGLHNILEAVTFGMPVCFGPLISRFPEAREVVDAGIAMPVTDADDLLRWLNQWLDDAVMRKTVSEKSRAFISKNTGATERVLAQVKPISNSVS